MGIMNKEMMQRIKMAGDYQRKAIRALFPEEMGEHLDVIEKEIKAMVMGLVVEIVKEQKTTVNEEDRNNKTKKVDIE